MTEEDLIQKLNKIERPEIELPSHRLKLRRVLLRRYDQPPVLGLAWPVLPVALALAVFLVLVLQPSFFPRTDVARAKEIALQDPEVQSLIKGGGIIEDVKIIRGRAYISLVKPSKEPISQPEGGDAVTIDEIESSVDFPPDKSSELFLVKPSKKAAVPVVFDTFSVEVNFREKKVTKVQKIDF